MHREIKGIIKSVTVNRNSINHYFLSMLCQEEISKLPKANKNIGIDLGIKEFAVMSDNTKVENLKLTNKYEVKLKREQRKLSKRKEIVKINNFFSFYHFLCILKIHFIVVFTIILFVFSILPALNISIRRVDGISLNFTYLSAYNDFIK